MSFSCQHRALCAQKNPAWGLGWRRQASEKGSASISRRPPLPGSPSVIPHSTNTFHFVLTFWQFPTNKHLALLHNSALLLGPGTRLPVPAKWAVKTTKKVEKQMNHLCLFPPFQQPLLLLPPL